MIPISRPLLGKEELEAVKEVLSSGLLAQGSKVQQFEEDFAKYIGTKHAIATSNGTTALHAALLSENIGKGDEVITTPLSFIASSNSILYTGAKPVFVDISEDDFNIDPALIEEKITENTKAVLIVHLYGQPCDMEPIIKICKQHNLVLIEDCCQAHGAEYKEKKVGSFGLAGCFSFYPTKNMTTGEGGMIVTNDDDLAEKAKMIINHGSKQRYHHEILGYNYRMTDIAAAIGIEQLKKLEYFIEKRISNASFMYVHLKSMKGIILPKTFKDRRHVFHQFTIRIRKEDRLNRDEVCEQLKLNKIGYGVYYPTIITRQPIYNVISKDVCKVAELISNEVLSIPIHPSLTKEDLERITDVLKKA